MIVAKYVRYVLNFHRPAVTSREIMEVKETWYLFLEHDGKKGIGECGMLRGLSSDDRPDFEEKLQWVCDHIHMGKEELYQSLIEFPSIQFAVEQAFLSLEQEHPALLFPSDFTAGKVGIPINGLLWMANPKSLELQFERKVSNEFRCVKMKVGSNKLYEELRLLEQFRAQYGPDELEIRLDANGAYTVEEVQSKLEAFAPYHIHSIEQPIAPGQWDAMHELCQYSPIPIALDEELIGVFETDQKIALLETIQPQFIILKPSFIGGFQGTDTWIQLAKEHNIGWWITSALESNVGLNAIAQYTYLLGNPMPQGLGTGTLYTNNIVSPLEVAQAHLWYRPEKNWDIF